MAQAPKNMSEEDITAEARLANFKFALEQAREEVEKDGDSQRTYPMIQKAITLCEESQEELSYETLEWVISLAIKHQLT